MARLFNAKIRENMHLREFAKAMVLWNIPKESDAFFNRYNRTNRKSENGGRARGSCEGVREKKKTRKTTFRACYRETYERGAGNVISLPTDCRTPGTIGNSRRLCARKARLAACAAAKLFEKMFCFPRARWKDFWPTEFPIWPFERPIDNQYIVSMPKPRRFRLC